MKLLEQVWQCDECAEKFTTTTELGRPREGVILSPDPRGTVPGAVNICIDFYGHNNPWIAVCPKCLERLEKIWPTLVAKFRDVQSKGEAARRERFGS